MRPYFLRFASEAEAVATLEKAGWLQRSFLGVPLTDGQSPTWCYHIAGVFHTKAVMEGKTVLTPSQPKAGFHVNVLAEELPEALQPYEVDVASPDRIFMGYPAERPAKGWAAWDEPE